MFETTEFSYAVSTGAALAWETAAVAGALLVGLLAGIVARRASVARAERAGRERERELQSLHRIAAGELDLEAALVAALERTARSLGASRCLVQIRRADGRLAVAAEWHEPELQPAGEPPAVLGVASRAVSDGKTVTLSVEELPALEALGSATVAATPLCIVGKPDAVLSAHRSAVREWSHGELARLEAAAAEISLAVRLGRLLEENRERLSQQGALLSAARVLSRELDLAAVPQCLANRLAGLLDADAADCFLLDRETGLLRCAAVHGFDASLLGFELPPDGGLAARAVREGRPVIASEAGSVAEPEPHPAYADFSDVIAAPVPSSDGVQGVLEAGRRDGKLFGRRDADVLEAFAGLASLALRNAETYTRSSRQARIQRGFYRIASALGQSLSRPATLAAVAQAAAEALAGASAAVLVPSGGGLETLGAYELPESLVELLAGGVDEREGALVRAAAQGRIVASPSLATDDRIPEDWRNAAAEHGFEALLSVPVEAPRGAGGIVLIFFAEQRSFTDDDLELARHLADATRGSLERSELFEAEHSARALAQQLSRTGWLLTKELDPAAVLDEVVQQAPELLNADAAAFRLLEDEELVVTAADGPGADVALATRSPAAAWLSGDVLQSGAPVAFADAGEDERLRALDPMLAAGSSAYLGVPVAGPEGMEVGVLSVYASVSRTWREEEIEALLALAGSTSAALANAELYQRVALEKERSVAILANIADGIVAVDPDDQVVVWNAAAERITGVPAAAALGRSPAEVLQRTLAADEGAPAGNRLVPIMRGREEVFLSLTEAVMRDPAGAVAGRIFAFRDISGDRLVEQVKSDFVSTVSHELRTPLTSIYGFAETLLRQDVIFGEEERKTFLGYIASESQRLTSIVDTLLNVARLDTGDLQVKLAPTDVRAVVGQVLEAADGIEDDGHRFAVDLPEEPLAARADPEKLRQVFSILLDNALRYSPAGATVTVGAARKRTTVEVSVSDEGIGIPQSDQEQIFRKFYRGADAEVRAGAGGTGVGLFIARGLVTAMGGRISVTSLEGEGSRFSVELPAAAATGVHE